MNIVQIIPYMHSDAGGPPVVVKDFHRLFRELGHNARLITTNWGFSDDQYARQQLVGIFDNIDILTINFASVLLGKLRLHLKASLTNADLIVLHTLWHPLNYFVAKAARSIGIPYLVMPHGMLDPNSLARKRLKKIAYKNLIENYVLRHASGLIFTTDLEEELATRALEAGFVGHIVPLGVDLPPQAKQYEYHPDLKLLFLGRLHEKKGLDVLIKSVVKLIHRGLHITLDITGDGDKAYIRNLAKLIPGDCSSKITFTGPRSGEDKSKAYLDNDLFVLSSHQENFAIVVAEAMSYGMPVIVSDRVNTWPYVSSANAGCVVSHDTLSQELEVSIIGYYENRDLLEEHGRNARDSAQTRLSLDNTRVLLGKAISFYE